jgi:hypothetical protein
MDLGIPSTLIHHNCHKIENSFMRNYSSDFPGIQIAALLYKESDGFTNFDAVQDNLNQEDTIDFNDLEPEQERVFQMVRSCLWEGEAVPELLDLLHLNPRLTQQKNLLIRSSANLRWRFGRSMPESISRDAINDLTWGPHMNNSNSEMAINGMLRDLMILREQRFVETTRNLPQDINAFSEALRAFNALIKVSDCEYPRRVYAFTVREDLCHSFIQNIRCLSCFFGALALNTVALFLVAVFAVRRLISPLERLEEQDKSSFQKLDDSHMVDRDEDEFVKKMAPPNFETSPQAVYQDVPYVQVPINNVEPMPIYQGVVYDDQGQAYDLVYVPPPSTN